MGEVLVTSPVDGGVPFMPELMARSEDKVIDGGGGGDSPTNNRNNLVRWEKFLPKMILRVLLVEADDSTRQVITALLRKCSYKVAAVSDGLKAWEVLKGRSHNIDLILTEVELPLISGFPLLTLIMEHQICKNIPVIMMSAHDSVSTVYKCMLRGAADFLVKPVRKNELKNLWQHVWRRQASTTGGNGHQEESDAHQKVEATAENNATSNRSSGYVTCIKRNKECIEKGSDDQSSCTKPDMEADVPLLEPPNDLTDSQCANQSRAQQNEAKAKDERQADTSAQEKNIAIDVSWEHVNAVGDGNSNGRVATIDTSREAIDLIGSFDSYSKTSYKSSLNYGANKIDHPSSMLDLSLRRSHPSSSVNQFSNGQHRLKQSDVSAFSRYINKNQPPVTSVSASISNQRKDCETSSDKLLSKNAVEYISDHHSAPAGSSQQNMVSQTESQSQLPSPKERVLTVPVSVPVRGLLFDNSCATLPPPFCVQPAENGHGHTATETMEDRGHISSATDHSTSSSFCNGGTLTRLNSVGSGSNGHVNLVIHGSNSHRSIQREAALNKFRMKRKDRCFDKKVRYESRKKLAEQRPRVKGQFVRQAQTSIPSPMEVDKELGTTKTMA